MKLKLATVLGNFDVYMTYSPSSGDPTLNNLATAINTYSARALVSVAQEFPDLDPVKDSNAITDLAIKSLDEAELEKALFESLRVGGGSAPRVCLSLKNRRIELPNG